MTVEEFSDKYNLTTPAIHVAVNQKLVPKDVLYTPVDDNVHHVREEWFIRRKNFKKKVAMYNQDMYFLVSKVKSDSWIAKEIGVSLPFICNAMWRTDVSSILSVKIKSSQWKAFRWFRKVEIAIARRYNVRFNISEILDAEAGIWGKEEANQLSLEKMANTVMVHQKKIVA